MSKLLTILSLSYFVSVSSVDANANHCGGGAKKLKIQKCLTDEDSKEIKLILAEGCTPLLNSLND